MAHVVLNGLTPLESVEFGLLDATLPFDGVPVWPTEDFARSERESRWSALWEKHCAALDQPQRQLSLARIEIDEVSQRAD